MRSIPTSRLALALLSLLSASALALPWPAGDGTEIGWVGEPGGLPEGFEPSGVVHHPGRGTVIIVDDGGFVSEMDPAGGGVETWDLGGDLEAVTLTNDGGTIVYIGVENPDGVIEFDLSTGQATGEEWDLTPWLDGPGNLGLEALTHVDGLFYAGLQNDGDIFIFDLLAGGTVHHLGTISSPGGRADISGLDYDSCSGTLYAVYDSYDELIEMTAAGSFIRLFDLAGNTQEGIALIKSSPSAETTVFVAEDAGEVWRYEGYPVEPCEETGVAPFQTPSRLAAWPNPFNPRVSISFKLSEAGDATLSVYDSSGRKVARLFSGHSDRGLILTQWDGRDDRGFAQPSGVYQVRLDAAPQVECRSIVLLR